MEKKTLILGVGNLLLKDEGVGIHVIRALEKETLPAHVTLMDGLFCEKELKGSKVATIPLHAKRLIPTSEAYSK